MKNQLEYTLQKQICIWINLQYPNLMYDTDTIASVRLTIPQQIRNKAVQKEGFKRCDLMIYKPQIINDTMVKAGLLIELKIEKPYKKDGTLKKNEHLEAQQKTINDLNKLGYQAQFCWTFEQAISIINEYLKVKK